MVWLNVMNQKGLTLVSTVIILTIVSLTGYFVYQKQIKPSNETGTEQAKVSLKGKIVYIHSGDVWVINPDGSEEKQLTSYGFNSNPIWSLDGQKITYSSSPATLVEKDKTTANCTNYHNIWIINRDGTDPVQITNSEAVRYPAGWSSDSKHIVFTENDKLIIYDLETKVKKVIMSNAPFDKNLNLCQSEEGPEHTPSHRASWYPPEDNVLIYSTNGIDFSLISAQDGKFIKKINDIGSWSPDRSKVAYLSPLEKGEPGSSEIVVLSMKDGKKTTYRVFNNQAQDIRWSPDGNEILYSSKEDSIVGSPPLEMGTVRILNLDTKQDRNISDKIVRNFVSERKDAGLQIIGAYSYGWSPDGKAIFLSIGTEEHKPEYRRVNQVNLVDPQTGTLVRTLKETRQSSAELNEDVGNYSNFSWSAI